MQLTQLVDPTDEADFPCSHGAHGVDDSGLYFPIWQATHAVLPVKAFVALPDSHCTQRVAPPLGCPLLYWPRVQAVHGTLGSGLN